jgi:hypothetical protein
MFKTVYIRAAPTLGKILSQSIPKALFVQDSCQKYFPLGRNLTQILKFGDRMFWDRARWENISRPNPEVWDLRFGTDFLCCGGDALEH